jgi:GNAT superfamily N-acetyltransferase
MSLTNELDAFLRIHDGDDHAFYSQYNKIDTLKYTLIALDGETAVGCGALNEYDNDSMEIKRMFVKPEYRKTAVASSILSSLEAWTLELGKHKCILETGKSLIPAIRFYKKCGYDLIPNFGQYKNVDNSRCFEKILTF